MTYDASKYRRLGVGETVKLTHYIIAGGSEIVAPVNSARLGHIIAQDDDDVYLEDLIPMTTETIAAHLGLRTAMGVKALAVALDNIKVLDSKQADYGSGNISAFGEYGVLVRVTDKHARLKNLLTNGAEAKNESIMDTWLDMANYAIIAVLCRKGEWR